MSSYNPSTTPNGTDLYSTTTRFGKAVTATASALIKPGEAPTGNDTLLSSSSYKNAMRDALNAKPSTALQRRSNNGGMFPNLYGGSFTSSSDYVKRALNTKKVYKVLTHISDDLLSEIPDQKPQSFSLFQGFNATLPAIDEEIAFSKQVDTKGDIHLLKNLTENRLEGDENDDGFKFKLPNGITKEKIGDSYSSKKLNTYKDHINDNLDLLEIRKNLAASEIIELDNKIAKLQGLRKIVFQRVAKLEQNELFLESHLQDIYDRIQMIKDYNMDRSDDERDDTVSEIFDATISTAYDNENKNDEIDKENRDIDDPSKPLLSQSIYGKLQEKPPVFKKKHAFKNRKTTPTLQQYYEPGTEIRTLEAHEESVVCFDFDFPFGTLVSASVDNTLRIWDLSRGKCTGLLEGHNASVSCMQMDDNIVVTGSLDATLKLWDLTTHTNNGVTGSDLCIHTFESHIEEITALSFHNYNLVSGSQDRTIRQWDLHTGQCKQTIDVLWASQLNSSTVVENSTMIDRANPFIGALQTYDAALATGSSDGVVRLWDLRSGEVVRTLMGHTGPVTTLQFDDKHLATGSLDRSIRIWDLRTGGIHDAFAYESPISSLQFDSRRIVSSNNEVTAKIYDRVDEKHSSVGGREADSAIINYVRYKEGYLIEGRADGKIGIWAI